MEIPQWALNSLAAVGIHRWSGRDSQPECLWVSREMNWPREGVLVAEFEGEPWERGDELVRYLRKQYRAQVFSYVDGPGDRVWYIRINGQELVVYQDDMGLLSLYTESKAGEELVTQIGESLLGLGQTPPQEPTRS